MRPVTLRNNTTTAITITMPRTSHKVAVPASQRDVSALKIAVIAGGRMYPAKIAPMNKAIIEPTILLDCISAIFNVHLPKIDKVCKHKKIRRKKGLELPYLILVLFGNSGGGG